MNANEHQFTQTLRGPREIRAPHGSQLHCKNWLIEAAYRMIQNNLDPDVAERPQDLVVYGGIGKAARNWSASTRFSTACAVWAKTSRCSCSRASPSEYSAPMPMRRVC